MREERDREKARAGERLHSFSYFFSNKLKGRKRIWGTSERERERELDLKINKKAE